MQSIEKPVSLSLIMLWTHERGEFTNVTMSYVSGLPIGTIVDKNGDVIDPTDGGYDVENVYGVVWQHNQVYHSWTIFNDEYILWPEAITNEQKQAVIEQLAKTNLVIKAA